MNPGGPGGSGVDLVFFIAPAMPPEIRERFDLVGFDPRGVAHSRQVECWTGAEYDAAFSARSLFPRPPSVSEALLRARSSVDACVQRSGDLLPYIGTEYVARDMDLLPVCTAPLQFAPNGESPLTRSSELDCAQAALAPPNRSEAELREPADVA